MQASFAIDNRLNVEIARVDASWSTGKMLDKIYRLAAEFIPMAKHTILLGTSSATADAVVLTRR